MAEDLAPLIMKTMLPMKIFDDLASVSQKQRVAAVEKLEHHLLNRRVIKKEGDTSADADVAYTIKRLVRGLASNRKLARVGFATALANCLSKQCVPLSDTLASLSDPSAGAQFLKTSGTMGKADRTHTIIGQLFFVATIAKGILEADQDVPKKIETSDVTKLVSLCVDAFKQKPILRQMACSVLGQLIAAVTKHEESAFNITGAIFKVVQPVLSMGWASSTSEIDAADLLLLALVAEPVVPSSFWFESSWLSSDDDAQPRQSFIYMLLSDPGKIAAVIVSARHTPFIHLAAVKIVEMLSPQLCHRKTRKRFFTFWSEFVNERLLLPTSAITHKTAALQLGAVTLTTLLRQAPSLIPVVLSSQMIQLLSSGLRRPHSREHGAVVAFFDELISGFSTQKTENSNLENEFNTTVVEASENYQLAILASFMRPPTRVWNEFPNQFDKMLRASPPATVAKIFEMLKSIAMTASFRFNYEKAEYIEDDAEEGNDELLHHRWEEESVSLAARRWAVSHLASNLTVASPVQSSGDMVSIISTVCNSCLLTDKSASELTKEDKEREDDRLHAKAPKMGLFPREQAVNLVLRCVSAATSPGIAEHLAGTSDCIGIMKSVLGCLKKRFSGDDESQGSDDLVILPLGDDAKKAFQSLLKFSKKKTQAESVLELLRLFACHAAVLLVCYPNDADITQLGKEIVDLFSTVADSDEEEGPARVFLDMLISLLSRKSRPVRQVTTSMFVKLISNRKILGLLTSSSNEDSNTQTSSLIDLIVNALLNTQFVEDGKDSGDSSDEHEDDESIDRDQDDEEDEGNGDDGGTNIGKKLKMKRKRTASGHIVASTAPANNEENGPNNNDDNVSSVDSMLMDDDEMFRLDSVFAAAVREATSGGGPAKRAKRERKNKLQEMKEFHMKLVSWLEMIIQKAQQIAKENGNDAACDGNKILADVISILMNTLANKKKVCSMAIELRFCELVRMCVTPLRSSKAVEDGSLAKVAKAIDSNGKMILDASLQIVRNISSIPPKLETAAHVVELLLLCSTTADSSASKLKSITAALQNSVGAYLTHPSPHGHAFFSVLLSSTRIQLKHLERIFFDRLLSCLSGKESKQEEQNEGDHKSDEKNTKTKSFPRSQAARLLANSQLITVDAYKSRPRVCQEISVVLDEIVQSFVADKKDEQEELVKDSRKSTQQPFLYRNVIDLVKRHVYSVLKMAATPAEREEKLKSFSEMAAKIEVIRDNSLGKKSADVRQACAAALKMLKMPKEKKQQPQKTEKTPEGKSDVGTRNGSGKKRQSDSISDDASPEISRQLNTTHEMKEQSATSSAKKKKHPSQSAD